MIDEEARDAILSILDRMNKTTKLNKELADMVLGLTKRVMALESRQPGHTDISPQIIARAEAARKAVNND